MQVLRQRRITLSLNEDFNDLTQLDLENNLSILGEDVEDVSR